MFLVGIATGDLWTDFITRVEGPRGTRTLGGPAVTKDRAGVRWIGALTTVPGVPWLVWVAQSQAAERIARRSTRCYRVLYAILMPVLPLIRRFAPEYVTTTEQVGRAMITAAVSGSPKRILENPDINAL